jgi:hypothetical protein
VSKKPKPQWMSPPTQDRALSEFKPMGFYAPYGSINWGSDGYSAALDNPYMNTQAVDQYQSLRNRLLGDIGITGADREASLDAYGNAFLNKSLEYSAPRLQAMTYGRGQAGSRMAADAYADLVNKASTDAVLSREQLRNIDEQLKIQQLSAAESGLTSDLNRQMGMINQLLSGVNTSQNAEAQSVNQANNYANAQNALEAERYQRSQQANPFLSALSPYFTPAGVVATAQTGNPEYLQSSIDNVIKLITGGLIENNQYSSAGGMNMFGGGQPGWAVPGMNGYGYNTPQGVYSTGSMSMFPSGAF